MALVVKAHRKAELLRRRGKAADALGLMTLLAAALLEAAGRRPRLALVRAPAGEGSLHRGGTDAGILLRLRADPPLHSSFANCRSEDGVDGHAVVIECHPTRQLAAQAVDGRGSRLAILKAIGGRRPRCCDEECT